jgi:hypothetical protein
MQSDFSDLRFFDTDHVTPLSHWIESYADSAIATVWVKLPLVPGNATKDIYMQFSNGQTVSASNGTNVFALFDDFSGTGNTSWELMGRTDFYQRIYNMAFGCMLNDTHGKTVVSPDGDTWLYVLSGGAHAVPLNLDTLTVGSRILAKTLEYPSTWASAHLVIKISESMYVMVYTANTTATGKSTRIATSATPYGPFVRYQPFEILATTGWEIEGGPWLESGIRYILDYETETTLSFWLGIENAWTAHLMGWCRVVFDKTTGSAVEAERYAGNPLLALRLPNDTHAYGGGNLDQTGLNLGATNLMLYEGRYQSLDLITYALSTNPFFDTVDKTGRLDVPLLNEVTIEKFQWVIRNDTLLLFYQLQQPAAEKSTVVRKYKAGELPGLKWVWVPMQTRESPQEIWFPI